MRVRESQRETDESKRGEKTFHREAGEEREGTLYRKPHTMRDLEGMSRVGLEVQLEVLPFPFWAHAAPSKVLPLHGGLFVVVTEHTKFLPQFHLSHTPQFCMTLS